MTYEEMKDISKAAATAYVTGTCIQDPKEAVNKFIEVYDYSLKKLLELNKEKHKDHVNIFSEYENKKLR